MKTAIITGGTRGIGKATALAFAKKGYNTVILYSSNDDDAQKCKAEFSSLNLVAEFIKADVSDEKAVNSAFDKIFNKYKTVSVLVNNAGVSLIKLTQDTTLDEWNKIIGVNLTGAFLCSKKVIDKMLDFGGAIVNVSSMWGEVGASCEVAYSASKSGLIGFTKALAKELALSDITVNCVTAGFIDTKMNDNLSDEEKSDFIKEIPLNRIGSPQDVANAIVFLAENRYITGQILGVNGGFVV